LCPEGVEIDLVVAPDLQVLQAAAAGQEVVGDVQDVVALVVGQVPLQQVEVVVDVPDQVELPGQEVDGSDAARGDSPCPVGQFIVDVTGYPVTFSCNSRYLKGTGFLDKSGFKSLSIR
jgi:hypothetical protein